MATKKKHIKEYICLTCNETIPVDTSNFDPDTILREVKPFCRNCGGRNTYLKDEVEKMKKVYRARKKE